MRVRWSLLVGGLRERGRQSGLTGDSAPPEDRVRAGTLLVLAAWAAFVLAGGGFAKFSEHFDSALPAGARPHAVPDAAFTLVQWAASVTGLVVIAGLVLAAPTFGRFLTDGGWSTIHRRVTRAAVTGLATAAVTIVMVIEAHQLTTVQRNGGLLWYTALFLAWGGLVALTMVLWTVAAITAARRLVLPRRVLIAEAALATAVTAGMVLMVGATLVWWISMAGDAPHFLNAGATGAAGSPWNPWLAGIVGAMALAAAAAMTGTVRVVRTSSALLGR